MQISTRVTCARRIKRTFFIKELLGNNGTICYIRLSTQDGYGRSSRRGYPLSTACCVRSTRPSTSVPRRQAADQLDVAQPTFMWRFHSTNQKQHKSLRLQLNQGIGSLVRVASGHCEHRSNKISPYHSNGLKLHHTGKMHHG